MNSLRWYRHPALQGRYYREENENCDFVPSTNVQEDENAYRLELSVPGFSKKDFKIDLEKNLLTISSEVKEEKKEENVNYTRKEFVYGNFCRSFTLPEIIEAENIKAEYKNGILLVTLPKKEEVKIKKEIQIV